jgi:hypothetical protein
MSAPMVRALLDGRKLQTRRIIKRQPPEDSGRLEWGDYYPTVVKRGEEEPGPLTFGAWSRGGEWATPCKYGRPGDLLWVRETWAKEDYQEEIIDDDTGPSGCYETPYRWTHYRATPHKGFRVLPDWTPVTHLHESQPASASKITKWKPSIFMPRWASRLTLRLIDVRVERLQEISYEDAIAEGLGFPDARLEPVGDGETWEQSARRLKWPQRLYEKLWESINGEGSWAENPWCWALTFDVIHANVDTLVKLEKAA